MNSTAYPVWPKNSQQVRSQYYQLYNLISALRTLYTYLEATKADTDVTASTLRAWVMAHLGFVSEEEKEEEDFRMEVEGEDASTDDESSLRQKSSVSVNEPFSFAPKNPLKRTLGGFGNDDLAIEMNPQKISRTDQSLH